MDANTSLIPIKPNSITFTVAVEVMQYLDFQRAVAELSRITNTDGLLHIIHHHVSVNQDGISGLAESLVRKILRENRFNSFTTLSNPAAWNLILGRRTDTKLMRTSLVQSDINHYFASKKQDHIVQIRPFLRWKKGKKQSLRSQGEPDLVTKSFLLYLLSKFDRFFFLSPHLDDAVLSCGNLMEILNDNHKQITVISIFTSSGTGIEVTPQARYFLEKTGHSRLAAKLFSARKIEDKHALAMYGASFVHLDYIDAAFRLTPDNTAPLYRTEKQQFSGIISSSDYKLVDAIAQAVVSFAGDNAHNTMLLSPIGFGGHADHVISRMAGLKTGLECVHWADYPYVSSIRSDLNAHMILSAELLKKKLKVQAISCYKTQLHLLFPSGQISNDDESYYAQEE
jgi:LmbE family N-acetylglucosaminyl deacetylase